MKIKELINILQTYDENLEVWIEDEFGRCSDLFDEDEIFVSNSVYGNKKVLIIRS